MQAEETDWSLVDMPKPIERMFGGGGGGDSYEERASPVVGQCVFLPISAAARAELVPLALVVVVVSAAARAEQVPLALVVVVRVPNVQVKQAPERPHLRSIAHTPA